MVEATLIEELRESADGWEECGPAYVDNAALERRAADALAAKDAEIAALMQEIQSLKGANQ